MKYWIIISLLIILFVPGISAGCINRDQKYDTYGILSASDFYSYSSCPNSSIFPQLNENDFYIPEAPNDINCVRNFLNIVSYNTYSLGGIELTAMFKGAAIAPNPYDEMVIFVANDIINWEGQEFGIRCSLKDNVLYGYVQDGNGKPGGVSYFKNIPLGAGDGSEHSYKILVQKTRDSYLFQFYIDNQITGKVNHSGFLDHTTYKYYVVMTTHRWESGWDSTGLGMSINNIHPLGID